MKVFTTLVLAATAGLGIYAARRRILLALKVGAVVYLVLLPLRLLFSAGSLLGHLDELVWPAVGVLSVWLVLWWVSTTYARTRTPRIRKGRAR